MIDSWIPNICNGYFFGVSSSHKNVEIESKHYLNLFKLSESIKRINCCGDENLFYLKGDCNFIYQYFESKNMDLYIRFIIIWLFISEKKFKNNDDDDKNNNNKNKNIVAFQDHFSKYLFGDGNRLIIGKNWKLIHPKLKILLQNCLINNNNFYLKQNIHNIQLLDVSYSDVDFGINGIKWLGNIVNNKNSTIKILKMSKCGLTFKCCQLLTICLLSMGDNLYSNLVELNISYNYDINDASIYLLLNRGINKKCINLRKLYIQWLSLTDLSCKYIVEYYSDSDLNSNKLIEIYLNGNKNITIEGAIILNGLLQGMLIKNRNVLFNLTDCQINVSSIVKFDPRLLN